MVADLHEIRKLHSLHGLLIDTLSDFTAVGAGADSHSRQIRPGMGGIYRYSSLFRHFNLNRQAIFARQDCPVKGELFMGFPFIGKRLRKKMGISIKILSCLFSSLISSKSFEASLADFSMFLSVSCVFVFFSLSISGILSKKYVFFCILY